MSTEAGPTSFEAAEFLLGSTAIVCGTVLLLLFLSNGTNAPRSLGRTFFGSIVALAIFYLLALLLEASMRIPSGNGTNLHRWECVRGRKGGKRPFGDTSDDFRNPCYNHSTAETNGTDNKTSVDSTNEFASTSNTGGDGGAIEPYISAFRDCQRAQSNQCSHEQPCTPCELLRREEFHNSAHGWTRCQACSTRNNHGECDFIAGVGPYCLKNAGSQEVVPCRTCCTEGVPMLDRDGVCY